MVEMWNIPCVYAAMSSACSFFMLPLGGFHDLYCVGNFVLAEGEA